MCTCVINGKEYNSDTGRIIRKFDIYVCDLGEMIENGPLAKKRPCVIVQANRMIDPKQGLFLVAPIRNEHNFGTVTREKVQEIVDYRRERGKIYVPVELFPNDFSFIDITEMKSVTSVNILSYKNSIINPAVQVKINNAMKEFLFDDGEFDNLFPAEVIEVEAKEIVTVPEEKSEPVVELKPIENTSEIGQKLNKVISEQVKENEQKIIEMHKKVKRKEISKSTAAKKLGLTLKAYDEIIKQINKEDQEEKKTKSTYVNRPLPKSIPAGFSVYVKQYDDNKLTAKQIAKKIGKSEQTVYNYIARYRQLQAENKNVVTI